MVLMFEPPVLDRQAANSGMLTVHTSNAMRVALLTTVLLLYIYLTQFLSKRFCDATTLHHSGWLHVQPGKRSELDFISNNTMHTTHIAYT